MGIHNKHIVNNGLALNFSRVALGQESASTPPCSSHAGVVADMSQGCLHSVRSSSATSNVWHSHPNPMSSPSTSRSASTSTIGPQVLRRSHTQPLVPSWPTSGAPRSARPMAPARLFSSHLSASLTSPSQSLSPAPARPLVQPLAQQPRQLVQLPAQLLMQPSAQPQPPVQPLSQRPAVPFMSRATLGGRALTSRPAHCAPTTPRTRSSSPVRYARAPQLPRAYAMPATNATVSSREASAAVPSGRGCPTDPLTQCLTSVRAPPGRDCSAPLSGACASSRARPASAVAPIGEGCGDASAPTPCETSVCLPPGQGSLLVSASPAPPPPSSAEDPQEIAPPPPAQAPPARVHRLYGVATTDAAAGVEAMRRTKSASARHFSICSPLREEFQTSPDARSYFEFAQSLKDQGLYKPRFRSDSCLSLVRNRGSTETGSIWAS